MAVTRKRYTDLPNTSFPQTLDNVNNTPWSTLMEDVSADTIDAMNDYDTNFAAGNFDLCANDLNQGKNGHKLKDALFNAARFNWIRDSIMAIERFFLEDVVDYVNSLVEQKMHISSSTVPVTDTSAGTVTYSVKYLETPYYATLDTSAWGSSNGVFKQTVSCKDDSGNKIANEDYFCYPILTSSMNVSQVKAYNKAFAMLYHAETTSNGTVTFYAQKKPVTTIRVCLKHI